MNKQFLICALTISSIIMPSKLGIYAEDLPKDHVDKEKIVDQAWKIFTNNDKTWSDFKPYDYEKIFDINSNEMGALLYLASDSDYGYAVVQINDNYAVVLEAGKGCVSPYEEYKDKIKIYGSPLNYYVADTLDSAFVSEVTTGEIYSKNDVENLLPLTQDNILSVQESNSIHAADLQSETTIKNLTNYSGYFQKHPQPDGYSCVPTSHAMALKYLHNRGKITISSSMTNLSTMTNTLYNLMKNSSGLCREPQIQNGLSYFASTYTNKTITTSSTYGTAMSFATVKSEIDAMYPTELMFKAGTPNMYSSNHATTMVGYKIISTVPTNSIQTDQPQSVMQRYAIVVDPGVNPAVEKTMLWTNTYLYGYFVLTVY